MTDEFFSERGFTRPLGPAPYPQSTDTLATLISFSTGSFAGSINIPEPASLSLLIALGGLILSRPQ
ncbi:MAG: PEP-CTERM sorting domain-containing protein [Phycisphaeraceae bacterium]